jgi:hypothetical protein
LNGLQRQIGKLNVDAVMGAASDPFSVEDVDWTKASAIAAAAAQQLAMPQAQISGIEVYRPNPVGPSMVLWKIEITNQNQEKGYVLADVAGTVKKVVPPESRRKASDYYDPQTMTDIFARLGTDFGQDRNYAEITFFYDKVLITSENHMQPGAYSQFVLSDSGYNRASLMTMSTDKHVPFKIGELAALTADRIRELEAKTIGTLKLPPKSIASITIGRGSMDPSPRGNVTIEIRAEEKPLGRAGRVNYELDGTVIKTYLPQ